MASEGKLWVPLENNPDVMTRLAHRLGLDKSYAFFDVLSLNDTDLLGFLPRPCVALLFTFPVTPTGEAFYKFEDDALPSYTGSGPSEPVLFYHQTVGHACGLIGLLHCTTNLETQRPGAVAPASILESLIKDGTPLQLEARAKLIYDSEAIEIAHQEAAQQGDSIAPVAEEYEDGNGFIAFVKGKDGGLWELEGRHKGPIKRGELGPDEDLLCDKALELGPRAYVRREEAAGAGDIRFSCTALCEAPIDDFDGA